MNRTRYETYSQVRSVRERTSQYHPVHLPKSFILTEIKRIVINDNAIAIIILHC